MGQLPFVCTKTAVAQDFKSKDCLRSYKAGTAVPGRGTKDVIVPAIYQRPLEFP